MGGHSFLFMLVFETFTISILNRRKRNLRLGTPSPHLNTNSSDCAVIWGHYKRIMGKWKTKNVHTITVFTSPRWMQFLQWLQSTAKWKSFTICWWLKQKNINYLRRLGPQFSSTWSRVYVPSAVICLCAPSCPWPPLSPLTLFSRSPSPSLRLLVKADKPPPACCHMELINRTGGE